MAANIQERDQQTGTEQAWHGMTNIVECVSKDNSMDWDVVETPILYRKPPQGEELRGDLIEDPNYKVLLANDDWQPVGQPYGSSYHPSSTAMFWKVIKEGMKDVPYKVMSAGSVDDRQKIFASLKISDGFRVGDREFNDFITLLDSFDKSTSLQARYTNVCVVCQNTFQAAMYSGNQIGKVKHTLMIEENVERLIKAIECFTGTSQLYEDVLTNADKEACTRDEAKSWLTGIEGRNATEISNALLQKSARMTELFDNGKGNSGRTRLDALSAFTEFHTFESSNRKQSNSQYLSSEWGASGSAKTMAITTFEKDWNRNVAKGESLLAS